MNYVEAPSTSNDDNNYTDELNIYGALQKFFHTAILETVI